MITCGGTHRRGGGGRSTRHIARTACRSRGIRQPCNGRNDTLRNRNRHCNTLGCGGIRGVAAVRSTLLGAGNADSRHDIRGNRGDRALPPCGARAARRCPAG